jgi:hypothetical protein
MIFHPLFIIEINNKIIYLFSFSGLRRITNRISRTGTGSIERMGSTSANAGVAAIRGLYKVSRAYANGFEKATKNAYNGLSNVGRTYKRGFSRVGSNIAGLANAYSR